MLGDEFVHLRQEFFLFFVVADDDSSLAEPCAFRQNRKLRMRRRCGIIADLFDEISIDLL